GPGSIRPGFPLWIREREVRLLAGEIPRGRRLCRAAAFPRACLPDRGLRRCPRLRARLHAHVPDPEGPRQAMERRPGDPGTGRGVRHERTTRARIRAPRSADDGSAARGAEGGGMTTAN